MKNSLVRTIIIALLIFAVLFLFNFIGNSAADRYSRAALVGLGGAAGYLVYAWLTARKKDDQRDKFDFD